MPEIKSMREASRLNLSARRADGDGWTLETINCGSLQRIADAVEIMSKNYKKLIEERDFFQQRMENAYADLRALERSNRSLRGVITRLKRRTE